MSFPDVLPIEDILASRHDTSQRQRIGTSRGGRAIHGFVFGSGATSISLIAGCHADEPVGPATLKSLAGFLSSLPAASPWLERMSWRLVPDANPDGRFVNRRWYEAITAVRDHQGNTDRGYALGAYLEHVVRELPGDDIEFGFPRDNSDIEARPENRAVADFLAAGASYDLHGSLHGMGFAPGPWFLIEEAWIDRTSTLRAVLRQRVAEMGYRLFDPDRKGEKGFRRIDEGFSTRPDSVAMRRFFEDRGEEQIASRFRPSSMEHVRGLGGDPLTFVSEMPLFLTPVTTDGRNLQSDGIKDFRARLEIELSSGRDPLVLAHQIGISPMAIIDQQRLQLALLEAALRAVSAR
jgi:hypothetical protein